MAPRQANCLLTDISTLSAQGTFVKNRRSGAKDKSGLPVASGFIASCGRAVVMARGVDRNHQTDPAELE
ncbi:MAG TPA: hypothetical protein VFQ87_09340 [Bradyrhizobium sp.]|jgi:hypothetical protein|nr:hypothetical protein [Bradyrhizobium sp.]